MKYRFYSFVLLFILIFNIFRFEIPYIQYAIFKTYIAENLCINKDKPKSCCEGKCFREKQLKSVAATTERETTNEKNSNKIPQNKEVREFLQAHTGIPEATETAYTFIVNPGIILFGQYFSTIFVPPKQ